MENLQEWIFLFFGLGFFTVGMRFAMRDQRDRWQQRMQEQREFGQPLESQEKQSKLFKKH